MPAAAARKPPASAGSSSPRAANPQIPGWLNALGWVSVPLSFFTELPRLLTPVERDCLGNVWAETFGRREKPEWTALTHDLLAERIGVTPEAIRLAMDRISPYDPKSNPRGLGLVDREKDPEDPRRYRYRPCREYGERIKAIPPREPKRLPSKAEQRETAAKKRYLAVQSEAVCPGCGKMIESARCGCGQAVDLTKAFLNGSVRLGALPPGAEVEPCEPAASGESSSRPREIVMAGPQHPNSSLGVSASGRADTQTRVGAFRDAVERLERFWDAELATIFRKDAKAAGRNFFEELIQLLEGAPVEQLEGECLRSLAELRHRRSGWLKVVAHNIAGVWKLEQHKLAQQERLRKEQEREESELWRLQAREQLDDPLLDQSARAQILDAFPELKHYQPDSGSVAAALKRHAEGVIAAYEYAYRGKAGVTTSQRREAAERLRSIAGHSRDAVEAALAEQPKQVQQRIRALMGEAS